MDLQLRDWEAADTDWYVSLRQRWWRVFPDDFLRRYAAGDIFPFVWRQVAELDGRPAGLAFLWKMSGQQGLSVAVLVESAVQGRGVGRALERAMTSAAGGQLLLTLLPDDDERSAAVAEHWGFEVYSHGVPSRLDLDALDDEPRALLSGHEVVQGSLADLHQQGLELDGLLDVASTHPERRIFERAWLADDWDSMASGMLWVVVLQGRTPVAASCAAPRDADDWLVYFTCTHPDSRRQGLARAAKDRLHREVAARGGKRVLTLNEQRNTGMRMLNDRMGYVRHDRGELRMRREAVQTAAASSTR